MNKDNDIKRIQEAIFSEGQQRISLTDTQHLWTRYSVSIGDEWEVPPDDPIDIYGMVEYWVCEWVYKIKRR